MEGTTSTFEESTNSSSANQPGSPSITSSLNSSNLFFPNPSLDNSRGSSVHDLRLSASELNTSRSSSPKLQLDTSIMSSSTNSATTSPRSSSKLNSRASFLTPSPHRRRQSMVFSSIRFYGVACEKMLTQPLLFFL